MDCEQNNARGLYVCGSRDEKTLVKTEKLEDKPRMTAENGAQTSPPLQLHSAATSLLLQMKSRLLID